ncbi:MAG: KH domain-containing protein [Candidatus Aenigmatarchaeota archaeon]|nr:RNA-processing protein [Candidatus Aenigmarchaeota archaeon]
MSGRGDNKNNNSEIVSNLSVTIPEERVKIINKEVIENLKNMFNININKQNNIIEISGNSLEILKVKNIILAIGRGFSPEKAYYLANEEYILEMVSISNFSAARQKIIRSRIIGTHGKIREKIEEATNCFISVYGKTISIIGKWNEIQNAKRIIEMIINGAKHTTILKILNTMKKERL